MAKAMLIMDKSSSCEKCDISQKVKSKYHVKCPILKRVVYKFENCIPNDCPLREVPNRVECPPMNGANYEAGYNACVDEILGGESDETQDKRSCRWQQSGGKINEV